MTDLDVTTSRCELCGSPVRVVSGREGTNYYQPITAAIAAIRARDAAGMTTVWDARKLLKMLDEVRKAVLDLDMHESYKDLVIDTIDGVLNETA